MGSLLFLVLVVFKKYLLCMCRKGGVIVLELWKM